MKLLLQRVQKASVSIAGNTVGEIGHGLLIFCCGEPGDPESEVQRLATKVSKLRIFRDEDGKMNKSAIDVGAEALVVSQFTLIADWQRGNRPGFSRAAPPEEGERLYERFKTLLSETGIPIQSGQFGADMQVSLVNDGPVTIWIDGKF